jgi:hypothetical protein
LEDEEYDVRSDRHDEEARDSGEVHRRFNDKVTDGVELARGNLITTSWPKWIGASTSSVDGLDSFVNNLLLDCQKAGSARRVGQS